MAQNRSSNCRVRELPYQDYELIRYSVLSKRRSAGVKPDEDHHLYVDTAFPPDISSLTYVYSGDDRYDKMSFRRPKALLPEAVFTGVGGICDTPFPSSTWTHQDWLRAALIVMSIYVKFMERAIPGYRQFRQSLAEDYTGAYLFRLWRFGNWVDVVVDDFLPILDDKLAYSNVVGSPPELWLPLLEKAYAKCNKAYESIELGRTLDALTDLTGSICEHYRPDVAPPSNFFHILYKSCVNRSLMVCWRNQKRLTHTGFHYDATQTRNPAESETTTLDRTKYLHIITAVTKFPTVDGRWEEMVRLKCPYSKEPRWHGKYSHNDRLSWESLNQRFKEKYLPQEQKVADEYWISLEDMRCNFGGIIICSSSVPFSCQGLEAERMYSCDPASNNHGKCGKMGNVDRRRSLNDVFLDDNFKQVYTPKHSGNRRHKDGSQTNALYRNLFCKQAGEVTAKCDMFIKDHMRTDNGKCQLRKWNSSGDQYVGKNNSCSRTVTHFVAEASNQSISNSRSSSGPVTGQCSASDIYVDVQSLSSGLLPCIGGMVSI